MAEAETALAFTTRVANLQAHDSLIAYRQFARAMRGDTTTPGGLSDEEFDVDAHLAAVAANPTAAANVHICQALAAAIMTDSAALIRHAGAAAPLMPFIEPTYLTVAAHLVQAMALIARYLASPAPELLAELDSHSAWFAARASDAPGHLSHLSALIDAERAALHGDMPAAAKAFDTARAHADKHRRPWHAALIAERAANFYLALGAQRPAMALLEDAAQQYDTWGATAKVDQLLKRYPRVKLPLPGADQIDMIGIVKASQALSSQTTMPGLLTTISATLCALAGATTAQVLLHGEDGWYQPASNDDPMLSVEQAGAEGLIPLSAFRYVNRTQQMLVIDDAVDDDRFMHDTYFANVDCCSLLLAPIHSRGSSSAMLILENRLTRSAFSNDHLDVVTHIAGQLAVSLDNAQLYASLERKVTERTDALASANRQLEILSSTDPLTGLANRRQLTGLLEHLWRTETQDPLSAILVDIDHFKLFNDRYGHLAGDDCLRIVAQALSRSVRRGDLLARYGGEEFVVVLPGCDLPSALDVCHRLREAVVALDCPHADSPHGVVTISVGVASTTPDDTSLPDDLLALADAHLYRAKRAGRNRISAH